MPTFGAESTRHLNTLHPKLQKVLREAIKHADFAITCGFRNQVDQDKAYAEGKSKLKWPHGGHNKQPSRAVDVAPYPIDWNDAEAFTFLAGFIVGIGRTMGIKIIAGIDWDGDGNVREHSFKDRPHLQLHESEV